MPRNHQIEMFNHVLDSVGSLVFVVSLSLVALL